MPHPDEHLSASRPLEARDAEVLAERMAAFATASRLKLLYALARSPSTVEELADRTGLGSNAVSQQLRVLRRLRLVAAQREGRYAHYRLHDHHLLDLLAAIRHQLDHAERGWSEHRSTSSAAVDAGL